MRAILATAVLCLSGIRWLVGFYLSVRMMPHEINLDRAVLKFGSRKYAIL